MWFCFFPIMLHVWSKWTWMCPQHSNGLLIRYCKTCGVAQVKREQREEKIKDAVRAELGGTT
jgi:hypothetical protein